MAIQFFPNFEEFESAAQALGLAIDLRALLSLQVTFYEQYDDFVVVSLKGYDDVPDNSNNLLILSKEHTLICSKHALGENDYKLFRHTMQKEFGGSTVVTLLMIKQVLAGYQKRFDGINKFIDEFDEGGVPEVDALDTGSKHLRRLTDRVEDLLDLMIWLEDRKIRQVNTAYVSYDYDVLTAKARYLLNRCQNHRQEIQNIRNDLEVKNTRELNKRIEYLSYVVKRLTAITIVLMIPNIVAGHFGMNFTKTFIPWDSAYGEAAVIVISVVLMAASFLYMRKKDWF